MVKKESIKSRRNKLDAIEAKALSLYQQKILKVKEFIAIENICNRARNRLK